MVLGASSQQGGNILIKDMLPGSIENIVLHSLYSGLCLPALSLIHITFLCDVAKAPDHQSIETNHISFIKLQCRVIALNVRFS